MKQYHFPVQVYYEDTDHSGVVYHANYLKYFERAREDVIGIDVLIDLWHNRGIGFAVYTTELGYFEGAEFGEKLDIRSTIEMDGDYRIIWHQEAWRANSKKAAVKSRLELVCIDKNKNLLPILNVVDLQFD